MTENELWRRSKMLKWWRKNGGWYRDRTCDPYHVKVMSCIKNRMKSTKFGDFVARSFAIGSGQSRAIPGITRALEHRNQWMDDCLRWHGRVLTGGFRHYCPDWDFLPIDASVAEFGACTCPHPETAEGQWLHLKSGGAYVVMEHRLVVLEADLRELVLYMRVDGTGPIWARPAEEFYDGRFVRVKK